jgi:hypothetical protein
MSEKVNVKIDCNLIVKIKISAILNFRAILKNGKNLTYFEYDYELVQYSQI